MKKTVAQNNVSNLFVDEVGVTPGTFVTAEDQNNHQEELVNLAIRSGNSLNGANQKQCAEAVEEIAGKLTTFTVNGTFTLESWNKKPTVLLTNSMTTLTVDDDTGINEGQIITIINMAGNEVTLTLQNGPVTVKLQDEGILRLYYDVVNTQFKILQADIIESEILQNEIINGSCDIWQEGTSFAAIADGTYHACQFGYEKSGTMVHTVTKETSILPTGDNFNAAIKVDVTTADAAIAAGDYCLPVEQIIEGYNIRKMIGKYVTFGFWARDTKTGIHCVAFRNSGKDRSYVIEYTINSTDTWEYKTVTILMDNTSGTWDYTNGAGLRISWAAAVGSTYQTTANAWQTGNFMGTSNQVNSCDNTANNFYITGITFAVGKTAIKPNTTIIDDEIERCQRTFEKTYNLDVAPGTITDVGANGAFHSITGQSLNLQRTLIAKRVNPTIIWYSNVSGNANNVYDNSATADKAISSTIWLGQKSTGFPVATLSITAGTIITAHFTADARHSL
jgi:hypothetical protein